VQKLDALQRAHYEAGMRREREFKRMAHDIARTREQLDILGPVAEAAAKRADTPAHVEVGGRGYAERKDAAEPFAAAARGTFDGLRNRPCYEQWPVATINGVTVVGRRDSLNGKLVLSSMLRRPKPPSPKPTCTPPSPHCRCSAQNRSAAPNHGAYYSAPKTSRKTCPTTTAG
jgi:hypothetical protein